MDRVRDQSEEAGPRWEPSARDEAPAGGVDGTRVWAGTGPGADPFGVHGPGGRDAGDVRDGGRRGEAREVRGEEGRAG